MIPCISAGTRSRPSRTGPWMSASGDVPELNIDDEHALIVLERFARVVLCLGGPRQQIQHTHELVVAHAGLIQRAPKNRRRHLRLLFLKETIAESLIDRKSVV